MPEHNIAYCHTCMQARQTKVSSNNIRVCLNCGSSDVDREVYYKVRDDVLFHYNKHLTSEQVIEVANLKSKFINDDYAKKRMKEVIDAAIAKAMEMI